MPKIGPAYWISSRPLRTAVSTPTPFAAPARQGAIRRPSWLTSGSAKPIELTGANSNALALCPREAPPDLSQP